MEADLQSESVNFCENYYGDSSLAEVFQLNEQIEPKDSNSVNWKALTERFSCVELIVRETLQKTTDDLHILRRNRLMHELEHMKDWANDMLKA
jgi:hypothetical protein